MDDTSQCWLLLSGGNLRVWGGTLVAFSACVNKARIEWDRSLSLALATNNRQRTGAAAAVHVSRAHPLSLKCPTLQMHYSFYSLSHIRQLCSHAHPQTSSAQQPSQGQIAVAEDTRWNHQSQKDPSGQIKFVLMWAECNASRVKTGPSWLEGMRARRGFSRHPEANQSRGLERGCGFQRPTGTPLPLVTDSAVLQSILQRDEKQLEGWRGCCSNPHLFSANPSSERSWLFASTSGMEELWCSMIKVTLGCCES